MENTLVAHVLRNTPPGARIEIVFANPRFCAQGLDALRKTRFTSPFILEEVLYRYFLHYEELSALVVWDTKALFNHFGKVCLFTTDFLTIGGMSMDFLIDLISEYINEIHVTYSVVSVT